MGRPTLEDEKGWFLEKVQELGPTVGNKRLREALGTNWGWERYWATHKRLLDEGLIARARGRGGSVVLVQPAADEPVESAAVPLLAQHAHQSSERSYYEDCRTVVADKWVNERGYDQAIVEITATRGPVTGGIWMKPDITALVTKTYPYLPGRVFDIVTFEVKKSDAIDVRGLFEALSHRQFATLAYVVFFTGDPNFDTDGKNIARVRELARDYGVGVIVASDMADWETWEELVEPRRNTYNPETANMFIGGSFLEDARLRIIQWQK